MLELLKSVGVISSSPFGLSGGSEVSVSLLINILANRGIKVYVVSYPSYVLKVDNSKNIEVMKYNFLSSVELHAQPLTLLLRVFLMIKHLERLGVEIIHLYNVFPISAAGLYKFLGGRCPVVATLNNYGGICPTASYLCNGSFKCNWIRRYNCLIGGQTLLFRVLGLPYSVIFPAVVQLMKRLDGYIALSRAVKQIYIDNGFKENKIRVIPNFFESNFCPLVQHNTNIFHVLYVGTLVESKGVHTLIEAFGKMVKQRPNSKLTIVGDGPLRATLQNLVKNIGIENKVFFIGSVPHSEIWEYYKKANVFVHPGLWHEPFGRTLLEAMSVGLPCVVSDVGAPPEIVGEAGLVFPVGDATALCERLILLHDNYDLRSQLSANCKSMLEKYRPDVIVDQIIQFYDDVLAKRI